MASTSVVVVSVTWLIVPLESIQSIAMLEGTVVVDCNGGRGQGQPSRQASDPKAFFLIFFGLGITAKDRFFVLWRYSWYVCLH